MNPTSNEGMTLPPPIMEQPSTGANSEAEQGIVKPDQAPAGAEKASAAPSQPQVAVPAISLPLLPPVDPQGAGTVISAAASVTNSGIIGDDDLIEKEWVNKAKQIVALNRDDPYKQSEELTVFRADYMKKHYDKNIKLSK